MVCWLWYGFLEFSSRKCSRWPWWPWFLDAQLFFKVHPIRLFVLQRSQRIGEWLRHLHHHRHSRLCGSGLDALP